MIVTLISPVVFVVLWNKKEYDRAVMEQLLKTKLKVNSLDALIAMLCGKEKLTDNQRDKLYRFMEELKEDDGDNGDDE